MPLLAFPSEILDEVLGHVAIPPRHHHHPTRLGLDSYPNKDILRVAATCRLLRSLALKFIYSKLVAGSRFPILLHNLTTYPHIAACIRELTLWPRGNPCPSILQNILMSCTRLQSLLLNPGNGTGTGAHGPGSVDMILGHLSPESKKSLKSLSLYGELVNLSKSCKLLSTETMKGNFLGLREVHLEDEGFHRQEHFDSGALEYPQEASGELGSEKVESVGTLRLSLPFPYHSEFEEPSLAGRYFAKLMPNVKVLFLGTNSECTYSMLSTYAELGSNLTELVLEVHHGDGSAEYTRGSSHPHHFCEIIPKLSRNLTKFCMNSIYLDCITYDRFCHILFGKATDWPKLIELDVTWHFGCAGIKPDLIHTTMTELTQIRPQASLRLVASGMDGSRDYEELVYWNLNGRKHIAPVELFEIPDIGTDWPEVYSDMEFDDLDDYDDHHDFEHDIEDMIEDYFEDDE